MYKFVSTTPVHEKQVSYFYFYFIHYSRVAFADVIEPGMKEVKFYYNILNIDKYQDYVFLIQGIPSSSYEIINSSEFSFINSSQLQYMP
jgi:hypothetical protein